MRKDGKILSAFLAVLLLLSAFSVTALAESGSTTLTTTIPCTVSLQVGDHGNVTVDGTDYTGSASFQKDAGTVVTYTFSPNTLYVVDKVIYNGVDVTSELSGKTYTAPALTGNAALSVSFKLIGGGTPTYTVTFDANGHGTAPAAQTVLSGYTVTKPADPTASGWVFGGWYREVDCTTAFDFSTAITSNLTLYAKWTEDSVTPPVTTYTVTFDANGHGTAPAAQTVADGNTATEPTAPTESGWTFGGWYTEAACTNKFDFSTPITGDITLYAKWTENSVTPPVTTYTVTFKDGDSTLSTQTVNDGDKASKPADPTKSGYTFDGWYADSTFNAAFDFNTAITADTTVYAKFTKDSTDPVPVTKYTITYNLNGGTLDGKTGTVTVQVEDGTTITLPKPTRDGYTFDYWEGSKYEAGASYTVTGDHTFTAQWKANSTTGKPGNSGKDTSPKTGDETNLALWIVLMAGALAGLTGVGVLGRKKRKASK